MDTLLLRCAWCGKEHYVPNATGPDDAWHEECWQVAEAEQAEPARREGPKDYVDLPNGTRINSSTPRAKP